METKKDIVKKFLSGEFKEIGVELCIKCPMPPGINYIPVVDNCVHANLIEDGKRTNNSVRLHGKPSGYWYDLKLKCQYAGFTTAKPSGDLTGVICMYKND